MKNSTIFYDRFHRKSLEGMIIKSSDFTYSYLLSLLKIHCKKNFRILDIGCGVGSVSLYMASKGHRVVGFDISKKAITIATKVSINNSLTKQAKFYIGNFPYEIPKGKFDLVICSEVLEHIHDDVFALEIAKSKLNKRGLIIASSPSVNAPLYRLGLLEKFDKQVGHIRRYSPTNFQNLFKASGFKIISVNKTEGVLRNYLYTSRFGGFLLKVLRRRPWSYLVTAVDNILISIFGESNIYIVAMKK